MRFLQYLLAAHIAFGAIFIVIFKNYFEYSAYIIVLHLLLLAAGSTLVLLPLLFLLKGKGTRSAFVYTLIVLPLFDLAVLLVYSSTIISNIIWSGNVTLDLLASYISDIGTMRETLPALDLYLLTLFVSYVLLVICYRALFKKHGKVSTKDQQYSLKFISYTALAALSTVTLWTISFDDEDPGIWTGEPISNLFLDYIPVFKYDPALPGVGVSISAQQSLTASDQGRNVVIIMVDALRADHLKVNGYHRDTTPFLNTLIEGGELHSVEMVHSTCSESACGILSALSGKEFDNISTNTAHLGTILQSNGYTSSFIMTGNHAWGGLRNMYNADFLSDGETRERFSVNDDAGLIDDLEKMDLTSSTPNFLYFHLYSAHDLGLRHRQFNEFEPFSPSINPIVSLFSNESDRHQRETNNYDNGILQADYFIAQIFAELENKGILQNSIVYITSDHGQGFGEHGHYGHTRYLFEEHTRIPLLIYDSEIQRYQNLDYAVHVDIAPTVLDSLSIDSDAVFDGVSLFEPVPENRMTRHRTTIDHGWKLNILKRGNNTYKHLWEGTSYDQRRDEMLFEITTDPEEQFDVLESVVGQNVLAESMRNIEQRP